MATDLHVNKLKHTKTSYSNSVHQASKWYPTMPLIYKNKRWILVTFVLISIAIIIVSLSNSTTDRINPFQYSVFTNENFNQTLPLPRVLCLILTNPKYFLTRVKAVNSTWGPRCDGYYFITEPYSGNNSNSPEYQFSQQIPIAPIKNITVGYEHLTQKSVLAFLFAYQRHFNDYDWFIKADDDTYLFVDNLRAFLSDKNASDPVTFGYNFKVIVTKGYHSGGASYVLSRESLRRFHEAHNENSSECRKDGGAEDVEVAKCLRTKGVYPGKSVDEQNRELFHPLSFGHHFHGNFPDWLKQYAENSLKTNYDCCGDRTISFHYVSPDEIYMIDFAFARARRKTKSIEQSEALQ